MRMLMFDLETQKWTALPNGRSARLDLSNDGQGVRHYTGNGAALRSSNSDDETELVSRTLGRTR
jgi:hypothetical protein